MSNPNTPGRGKGVSGETGAEHSERQVQGGPPNAGHGGRGSSEQGPKQDARGGPAGASQGGASRGSSRLEPSHAHDRVRNDKPKHKPGGGKA